MSHINTNSSEVWPVNLLDAIAGKTKSTPDAQWEHPLPPDIEPTMHYVITQLSHQEFYVLYRRFHDLRTTDEVGAELRVTRERIRQIEAKALTKLRHPSRKQWLITGVSGAIQNARQDALTKALSETVDYVKQIAEAIKATGGITELLAYAKDRDDALGTANEILDQSIDVLGLPTRAYNCLVRNNPPVKICRQLTEMTIGDLSRVRNMGHGSIEDVRRIMHQNGLYLLGESLDARKEI